MDKIIASISTQNTFDHAHEIVDRLVRAVSATHRGGLLLFTGNPGSCSADSFILQEPVNIGEMAYEVWDDGMSLQLMQESDDFSDEYDLTERRLEENAAALERTIAQAGRFSGVDGAILFGHKLELVAFGCKLKVAPPTEHIVDVRSWPDDLGVYDMTQHGTRHRAAASFAARDKTDLAICISQDGPVRAFFQIDDKVHSWRLSPEGQ